MALIIVDEAAHTAEEIAKLKMGMEKLAKLLVTWQRKALGSEEASKLLRAELERTDRILLEILKKQEESRQLQSVNEYQQLAVLFLDLEGFSQMDEFKREKNVDMLRALAATLLPHAGGLYINMWGDAIVAGFSDPNDGLTCACKFIQHLSVEGMTTRIGMNYGQARVKWNPTTQRLDIDGSSINEGARLEPLAHRREVLISENLRSHQEIKDEEFIFNKVERTVKKVFEDKKVGDVVECYTVELVKNRGLRR